MKPRPGDADLVRALASLARSVEGSRRAAHLAAPAEALALRLERAEQSNRGMVVNDFNQWETADGQ